MREQVDKVVVAPKAPPCAIQLPVIIVTHTGNKTAPSIIPTATVV